MTPTMPLSGLLVVRKLKLDIAYNHTKFDDGAGARFMICL